MITTLVFIMVLFIIIIAAKNIVNSMIDSYENHNIIKTALDLILFQATCLVGLMVIIGYIVVL